MRARVYVWVADRVAAKDANSRERELASLVAFLGAPRPPVELCVAHE